MSEDLKPYKVEVDDHSDDCGTVYRLFGPSTSILHKDKDYLDEMAEHHNWGWYQAMLSVSGQGKPTPGQIGGEEALLTSKPEPVAQE